MRYSMKHKYNRLFYISAVFLVICLGLLSRRMTVYIPDIIDLFLRGQALNRKMKISGI